MKAEYNFSVKRLSKIDCKTSISYFLFFLLETFRSPTKQRNKFLITISWLLSRLIGWFISWLVCRLIRWLSKKWKLCFCSYLFHFFSNHRKSQYFRLFCNTLLRIFLVVAFLAWLSLATKTTLLQHGACFHSHTLKSTILNHKAVSWMHFD